ncbi:MAG: sialidase family protein [Acidimicrobiales bacterium]|jgi:hypothetical protein
MAAVRSYQLQRMVRLLGRVLPGIAVLALFLYVPAVPVSAAPGTSESGWVGLAFATDRLGAVLESTGSSAGGSCVLSLYTTVDGGTHWSLPIVFDRHAGCLEANLTGHSMVVTSAGTWWVATTQGLYRGSFRSSNFELLSAAQLPASAGTTPACSVSVAGSSIWATFATNCGFDDAPATVLRSGNGGATWTRDASFPLRTLAGPALDYGEPLSLVATDTATAYALGWQRPREGDKWPPLVLARTEDAGRTWHTTTLPCLWGYRLAGFLTVSGREVSALCLSGPYTGYEPMEVVTSDDGGVTWSERCNNGPVGLITPVGSCPQGGYPTSLVSPTNRLLEMGIAYVGGVDVSTDVGHVWRQRAVIEESSFLLISGDGHEVWLLPSGPVGAGTKMAVSADGRTWRAVPLPAIS